MRLQFKFTHVNLHTGLYLHTGVILLPCIFGANELDLRELFISIVIETLSNFMIGKFYQSAS